MSELRTIPIKLEIDVSGFSALDVVEDNNLILAFLSFLQGSALPSDVLLSTENTTRQTDEEANHGIILVDPNTNTAPANLLDALNIANSLGINGEKLVIQLGINAEG